MLIEFVLARIAEDEAAALAVEADVWDQAEGRWRYRPTRVLAECEAKRRIVERWRDLTYEVEQAESRGDYDAAPVATAFAYEQVVKVIAAVRADHPDYQEDWRL
jgi:hypothetical protein